MKKSFFAFFFVSILMGINSAFSEDFSADSDSPFMDRDEPFSEVIPDGEIDLESLENGGQNSKLDFGVQRNFNIIVSQWGWNLDPQTSTYATESQILSGLYEGLFSYDPKTLEPVPAVAESYKISRDKKRWTFRIRPEAKFSDGEEITAYSVRDNWIWLLENSSAPYSSLLDCIKNAEEFRNQKVSADELGIKVRDNQTLVVTLKSPTAHFSRILCHHAFSVCKKNTGILDFSGAFKIFSQKDNELILVKNENYWDAKNVNLPQITIKASSDISENSYAFNIGKADWISSMFDGSKLINKNSIRLTAIFGTEYLFFGCKNKPWNNSEFRTALLTAVPWSKLKTLSLVPAATFIYPLTGYPAVEGYTETSVEDAVEMIGEARKNAGYSENETIPLIFGIPSNSDRLKKIAEILKEAFAPLGVELKIQTTPENRYVDSINGWNADLFSYSWIGDFADPIAFLELFRGGSTLNPTHWSCEKYNRLLEESALSTDNTEHYKLLAEAEQLLLDEGMVIPVSHSLSYHAINLDEIGGWYANALDIHPFKYLYIKDSKAELPSNII